MIHRHDTECNNKIRFYAKMTPSLFMGRKHTQIRIPEKTILQYKIKCWPRACGYRWHGAPALGLPW